MGRPVRRKGFVADDSRPGWKVLRDYYLKRLATQLEEKK